MVGQKLIFEYSGYALHSGYANVYWSAIVRLGLLFPLPPRSRGQAQETEVFESTAFHTGPVIPKNGVLVDPPYRDRIHTTVCWNTPLPEPAIPVRYYRICPVSSSYRPVIPTGMTVRRPSGMTARYYRPAPAKGAKVLPSSPQKKAAKILPSSPQKKAQGARYGKNW